jgi:uncharacterized protein YprB with RNaseH-like and TPR domain
MDSLSDRLKSLGIRIGTRGPSPPAKPPRYPVERVIPGEVKETPFGEAYIVETHYPNEHPHGEVALQPTGISDLLAAWMGTPEAETFDPESFVYLDTETTGIAGGAGTFAFLVGVGRFRGGGFHLAQYFLRDPLEEPAQLAALEGFLDACDVIVTFNGKSFDLPLLRARYLLNGFSEPFASSAHLDLLHLARKLWRDRLPNRALSQIEAYALKLHRTEDDVPGWRIPDMYFDYLRSRDARPLKDVFYHNAMDILSMAALQRHVEGLVRGEGGWSEPDGIELIALGKLNEDLGHHERAETIYEYGLNNPLPDEVREEGLKRLSFLAKRKGDWARAIELWIIAAGEGHLYAHIELAKYFEHQVSDFARALSWTEQALERVKSQGSGAYERLKWHSDIEHRLKRLERKHRRNSPDHGNP